MAQSKPVSDKVLRFLLLGKTGSGKSTTGNTIFGEHRFATDAGFVSMTSKCSLEIGVRGDRQIQIMDSPGLFDTEKTQEEIAALVMQSLACTHPGPDAVLYVMPIGRYTDEEYGVYKRLKSLLDETVTKHMIIIFTRGDILKGKRFEEMLENTPPSLQQVLKDCDHRYIVFNNMAGNKEDQVEQLLKMVSDLQKRNGHIPYSCPKYASLGDKMDEEVSRRMAAVEEQEIKNKQYVQELTTQLEQRENSAQKMKKEFEEKENLMKKQMEDITKGVATMSTEHKQLVEQLKEQIKEQEKLRLEEQKKHTEKVEDYKNLIKGVQAEMTQLYTNELQNLQREIAHMPAGDISIRIEHRDTSCSVQ